MNLKRIIFIIAIVMLPVNVYADGTKKAAPKTELKKEATKKEPAKKADSKKDVVDKKDIKKEVTSEPKDTQEAIDTGTKVMELAKAKQWFAMSAGIIWLFMFLFKLCRKKVPFMQKIPKRVLWILVPILSVAAMVLSKLQGDLSWGTAMAVLFSGPSVAFLNDLLKRGVLGKEPSSMTTSTNGS